MTPTAVSLPSPTRSIAHTFKYYPGPDYEAASTRSRLARRQRKVHYVFDANGMLTEAISQT